MKRLLYLLVFGFCLVTLAGCPPIEVDLSHIENSDLGGKLTINFFNYYQEDNEDVLIFLIEIRDTSVEKIFLKLNTLDVKSIKLFASDLDLVDGLYIVDLKETNLLNYKHIYIEIKTEIDTAFSKVVYDKVLKSNIIAHNFDIYINNKGSESLYKFRFFDYDKVEKYYGSGDKMIFYNSVEDVITNTVYSELYLPFINNQLSNSNMKFVYYPNNDYFLAMYSSLDEFDLSIRTSDSGTVYGEQPKTKYSYNNIEFLIIENKRYNASDYSIDFVIINDIGRKIQYKYLLEDSSLEDCKEFARSINVYK